MKNDSLLLTSTKSSNSNTKMGWFDLTFYIRSTWSYVVAINHGRKKLVLIRIYTRIYLERKKSIYYLQALIFLNKKSQKLFEEIIAANKQRLLIHDERKEISWTLTKFILDRDLRETYFFIDEVSYITVKYFLVLYCL